MNRKKESQTYYQKIKNDPDYLRKKREWYLSKAKEISEENKRKRAEYRVAHPIVRVTEEQKKENERAWRQKNKETLRAKRKKWESENKEYLRQYHRDYNPKWYSANKEERSKQIKEYSKAHPKENVKRTQKYTEKNKEKVYAYGREYNKTVEGYFRSTQSGANKRKKDFFINLEEFRNIVSSACAYCGESEKRIGVDRIDNSIGYTKENSTACCKMCNYMKNKHSVTDFLSHIKKIASHNF